MGNSSHGVHGQYDSPVWDDANSNFEAPRTNLGVQISIIYAEGGLKICTGCSEESPGDFYTTILKRAFLTPF